MASCQENHEAHAVGWAVATYCVECSAWSFRWVITSTVAQAREQSAGRIPDDDYQDRNQERFVRRFLGTVRSIEEDAHEDRLPLELDWD